MNTHAISLGLALAMGLGLAACSNELGALKQGGNNASKGNSADASGQLAAADRTTSNACLFASNPVPAVCSTGTFTCTDSSTTPPLTVTGSCSAAIVQQQLFAQACKEGLIIVQSQVSCANAAVTAPIASPVEPSPTPTATPVATATPDPTSPSGNPACQNALGAAPLFCMVGSYTCTGGGLSATGSCNQILVTNQLFAEACKQGVMLTQAMVTCTHMPLNPIDPSGGGNACGAFPTNVGLTAEQTLCCNNGAWVAQLAHQFGGPATCGQ